MLRFAFPGSRARLASRGSKALIALASVFLASSCLTPTIDFGDDPATRNTGGTAGTGGGNTQTGGVPNPGDGGGMNVGGEGGTIIPPVEHCVNGSQDEDETDRNCGGDDCPQCALGKKCEIDSDCAIDSCVMGRCQAPDCADEVENGEETDVDCGSPSSECSPCSDGDSCLRGDGCLSGVCKSGKCATPACNDNVKNGEESDVDCGGTCGLCDVGDDCVTSDDCEQPPYDEAEAFVTCESLICTITCGPFVGDCNERVSDGCETNLLTSTAHCGACRAACAPDNAMGECSAGNCLIDTDAPDTIEGCLGNFANCNGETEDGCEADLDNDPETCGSCDTRCSDQNGTPDCDARVCSIECDPGFDNCNTDVSDGCEADLTVSTLHCTECFNACSATPPQVPVCDGTQCIGVTCDQPADCGGVQPCGACDPDSPEPLCNDVLNTTTHCGGCGLDCTAANATTVCEDNGGYVCAIGSCSGSYADCDEDYLNGCEIETDTNRNRCGGCLASDPAGGSGENCDLTKGPQVAQTSCSGGDCRVLSCNSGYADCNGTWSDGCEVNLNSNDAHCGGCTSGPTTTWDGGANCDNVFPNASGVCSAGQCQLSACDGNYESCNDVDADGCETLAQGDPGNCGGCGNSSAQYVCAVNAGTATNTCSGSATTCTPTCYNNPGTTGVDFGNCDGENWDGCEAGLQTSISNCGACGNNCTTGMHSSGATAACSSASCAIATCDPNLADCNGTWNDGCEINISNSATNCGGCQSGPTTTWDGGANCTSTMHSSGATAQCSSSACAIATCDAGLADCNGTWSDGCEVNTTTSASHCGGCSSGPTTAWDGGTNCTSTMHSTAATAQCVSGTTCAIATCDAGLADCNGTWNDGCEINVLSGNTTHCGGCQSGPTTTWDGGETCSAKPNATVSGCSAGACTYTCSSGWSNGNGSWTDGCEMRTITLVNNSDPSATTSTHFGDTSNANLVFNHTLATASGNHRLVLVGYVCRGNNAVTDCTPTITYGSTPMVALTTTVGSQSFANIYYLLDSSLPAPGTYAVTVDAPPNGWSGYGVQILEFSGVEQNQFYATFAGHNATGGCGATLNLPAEVTTSLSSLPTGTRIYAVGGGFSSSAIAAGPQSPLSLLGSYGTQTSPAQLGMAGAWTASTVTGTQTASFALSGCNSSAMMAVGIRPEANY